MIPYLLKSLASLSVKTFFGETQLSNRKELVDIRMERGPSSFAAWARRKAQVRGGRNSRHLENGGSVLASSRRWDRPGYFKCFRFESVVHVSSTGLVLNGLRRICGWNRADSKFFCDRNSSDLCRRRASRIGDRRGEGVLQGFSLSLQEPSSRPRQFPVFP